MNIIYKYSSRTGFYRLLLAILFILTIGSDRILYAQNGNDNGNGKTLSFEEKNLSYFPDPLIKVDEDVFPFIIVVDKYTQKTILYKYDGNLHRIKTLDCTTGANRGIKQTYGDLKTPEGVYFFNKIRDKEDLAELYGRQVSKMFGIRSFDISFPNSIDRILKRRGSGIWLHGTDKPERIGIPYDTRGCVVMADESVDVLTPYITLNRTPLIIAKKIDHVSPGEIEVERHKVETMINKWKRSWQNAELETYADCYSAGYRNKGMSLTSWLSYKTEMLNRYDWINVKISELNILRGDEYYYVRFLQEFETDSYKDRGIKTLYLIEEENKLKIIREEWDEYKEPEVSSSPGIR
ncbi:MAG: L,D-transpeptidase family protein [bacterium]|nr:L,D-transpeptidase family protein [bacterium]